MTELPVSRAAELLEQDDPPLQEPGAALRIDRAVLERLRACDDYGMRLLARLGGASLVIDGQWSPALALWLARHEPDAAEWLRTRLGLGVAAEGASLTGANLTRASLASAHLRAAILDGAYLWQANLEGAALDGASLLRANLESALLWRANLDNANLTQAVLQGARLDGAYLRGANLEGASLWRVGLEGAHLEGANLATAVLSEANLEGARREPSDPPIPGWSLHDGRLVPAHGV